MTDPRERAVIHSVLIAALLCRLQYHAPTNPQRLLTGAAMLFPRDVPGVEYTDAYRFLTTLEGTRIELAVAVYDAIERLRALEARGEHAPSEQLYALLDRVIAQVRTIGR